MKRSAFLSVIFLIAVLFFATKLKAQVPQLINYQGVLTDPTTGNPVADNTYSIKFAIYSVATLGTPLWSETQNVPVTNGHFNILLGSVDPSNNLLPYSLFDGSDRYLRVKVGTDAEMTPRKRIVSVSDAFKSYNADKVDGKDAAAFALVSHDHNTLYYTKTELSTSDGNPPNSGVNRVSWNNLKDVPAGFVDGNGYVGTSGGISQINVGTGMTVTNSTGPTTTLGLKLAPGNGINADPLDGKHASSFANTSHAHSGTDITSGKISNARLNTGSGNGLDADMVDGKHASNFANASHDHWGGNWNGSGNGLILTSSNGDGVRGIGRDSGVYGEGTGSGGQGVFGKGIASNAEGVVGVGGANAPGVYGMSNGHHGVYGSSTNFSGVRGSSSNGHGVEGTTNASSGSGVYGHSSNGQGVSGYSNSKNGVSGSTSAGGSSANGVKGTSSGYSGTGVYGEANNGSQAYGVWGVSSSGYAGHFDGDVSVAGNFTASSKSFKVDHPLYPADKYLTHYSIESDNRYNVYSGNVTLDATGEATIQLPNWFEALNKDFRYQLTCIGGFAQVYIADEIQNNTFKITGGKAGMRVSWQVTGVRNDAYAKAHPVKVEQVKFGEERGKYLNPEAFGLDKSMGMESVKASNK